MRSRFAVCAFSCVMVQAVLAGDSSTAGLVQRTQSFTMELNGQIADVTPLFGPVREAEWSPDWSPRFMHPAHAAQCEGAVFTTAGGHAKNRLWLLTTYDVGNGRVEYVVITPASTATDIKIRVIPAGDQHCKATVTYRRSALATEANEEVSKLNAHWAEEQRIHWEMAINEALAKGGSHD